MLSDKVPDRGPVPPQVRSPSDPSKVYAFSGGVSGIIVVCLIRNCLQLPDFIGPFTLAYDIGTVTISIGLQDVLLGAIAGSAIGVHFGKKALAKEDKVRLQQRAGDAAASGRS